MSPAFPSESTLYHPVKMFELFQHINMHCSLSPQYMGQRNGSSPGKRNS